MPRQFTEEQREEKREWQREYSKRTNYEANKKSNAKNTKMFSVRLTFSTDSEIIKRLEEQENVSAYLKRLIREDIERNP